MTSLHDLESAVDPKVIELEKQFSAHVVEAQRHLSRASVAFHHGVPSIVQAELVSVSQRLAQMFTANDRLMELLSLPDAPELQACPDCGDRVWRCKCEVRS